MTVLMVNLRIPVLAFIRRKECPQGEIKHLKKLYQYPYDYNDVGREATWEASGAPPRTTAGTWLSGSQVGIKVTGRGEVQSPITGTMDRIGPSKEGSSFLFSVIAKVCRTIFK